MTRLATVTVASILLLLTAPVAWAQDRQGTPPLVNCDSICLLSPAQVPPECTCMLNGFWGGGAGGVDLDKLTAADVVGLERSLYVDRMAEIQNFWVIEHSNVAPMPTVQYWERNPPGVSPPFRLVPPREMQQHWIDTDPNLTPDERAMSQAAAENPVALLTGIAGAVDMVAPALAAELPIGGALLEGKSAEVSAGLMEAAAGLSDHLAEEAKEQDEEFQKLMDETEHLFKDAKLGKGIYLPGLPFGTAFWDGNPVVRFQYLREPPSDGDEADWTALQGNGTVEVPCFVLSTTETIEVQGDDGTYVIDSAERWVAPYWNGKEQSFVPVYLRMEVRRDLQRVVVSRETSEYAEMAAYHRSLIAKAIKDRIQGLSESLPEVRKKIEVGGVNEGMPAQADVARITGGNVGVPGADPTKKN